MAVSLLRSERDGTLFVYEDYIFYKNKERATTTYYRCKINSCKAKLVVKDSAIVKKIGFHDHSSATHEILRKQFKERVRDRVLKEPTKRILSIYREEVAKSASYFPDSAKVPTYKSVSEFLHAARAKSRSTHQKTSSDLELSDPCTKTRDNKQSFLVDSMDRTYRMLTQAKSVEELGAKPKSAASINEPKEPKSFLSYRPPVAADSVQPTSTEETAITPDLRLNSAKETVTTSNLQPSHTKETVTTPNLLTTFGKEVEFTSNLQPTFVTAVIPYFQTPTISGVQPVLYTLNSINSEIEMGAQSLNSIENNICSNQPNASLLESQIIFKEEIIETEEDIDDSSFLQSSPSCSRDSSNHDLTRLSSFVKNISPCADNNLQMEDLNDSNKGIKRPCQNIPAARSFKDAPATNSSKDAPATYSSKDAPAACSSKDNLQENFEATDMNQPKDHLDEFGVFVVSKLRNLDRKSSAYVQKAIADILCDAESGHFTIPQEDNFEEMSDSTINGQHEAIADTTFLQSEASCSKDSTYYVSDSESSLIEKSVCSDKINSKFQNLKLCQKGVKRPRQNSPVARLSKDDPPENFDEPTTRLPNDHFDAFGVFAVSKLRTLDQKLCAYVQKAISNLLFDAELGLFLTPKEKTGFREKSYSIINRLQESHANISSLGV